MRREHYVISSARAVMTLFSQLWAPAEVKGRLEPTIYMNIIHFFINFFATYTHTICQLPQFHRILYLFLHTLFYLLLRQSVCTWLRTELSDHRCRCVISCSLVLNCNFFHSLFFTLDTTLMRLDGFYLFKNLVKYSLFL